VDEITGKVRMMYERYPYPGYGVPSLGSLNHDLETVWFDIARRTDSLDHKRVLDVGCGTGDKSVGCAMLYPEVTITAVDVSRESLRKARALGEEHGCKNVTFLEKDIMSLQEMEGSYDIIVAMGVVMLLSDPPEGLEAIASRLADDGVLSLYLYAEDGRRPVTSIQSIINGICPDRTDFDDRIATAKVLLEDLRRNPKFRGFLDDRQYSSDSFRGLHSDAIKARFVDQIVHVNERTYTVNSMIDLLDSAGLEFVDMIDRDEWCVEDYLTSPELVSRVNGLEPPERYAVVEHLKASFNEYRFVARKKGSKKRSAPDGIRPDSVPHLFRSAKVFSHALLHKDIRSFEPRIIGFTNRETRYWLNDDLWSLLGLIDGRSSVSEIADRAIKRLGSAISPDEVVTVIEDLRSKRIVYTTPHP